MSLRDDANRIIKQTIASSLPDSAVKRALKDVLFDKDGKLVLVAVGKAAWTMASAAKDILGELVSGGVVITKYHHSGGPLDNLEIYEAGHPVPDDNSFLATQRVIDAVSGLCEKDTVIFLVSGGGSALFEKPLISKGELENITKQLLSCAADIVEMNTLRKRLSAVKGGRFAKLCEPARVFAVVLSDIIGDPLDMIASGPAYPDGSTSEQALETVKKYGLCLSEEALECLKTETPKSLYNVETRVTGSVRQLCRTAAAECEALGYETTVLTDCLCCEAKDAGSFMASIARSHSNTTRSLAFIAGGETVVRLTGAGLGGRNQELALSAARGIAGLCETAVFSVGSDGTDGPTDAAGGYCDGDTLKALKNIGISVDEVLAANDSYNALKECGGLVITGPTGTNVNDFAVLLIKR